MADISRNSISQPQFQLYDMETWERAEYFHYYMDLIKTRYNLNVNIDITGFMQVLKEKNLKFFPSTLSGSSAPAWTGKVVPATGISAIRPTPFSTRIPIPFRISGALTVRIFTPFMKPWWLISPATAT